MKWYIRYDRRPRCSSLYIKRVGRTGEQPAEGTQEHRQAAADQVQVPAGVVVQPAQNVGVDLALGLHPHRQAGQGRVPRVVFEESAEVDVEEMPARAQHPDHLGEEAVEVRVGVRGLDVEHRVEGLIGERQVLGVAVHEVQARQVVPAFGEGDAVGVEVQSGVGGRVQRLHQVGTAAAVAAAGLQHLLAAEIGLRRGAVVELDAVSVGLVLRGQRQTHRRDPLRSPS